MKKPIQDRDREWNQKGNITDYFNYGFNSETYNLYIKRMASVRILVDRKNYENKLQSATLNRLN